MLGPRGYAIGLAALTLTALLLQLVLSARLGIASGKGVLHGLWQFLAYFTVLTNGLVAAHATFGALRADGGRDLRWRGGAVTAILLVGIGYHLLLRDTVNPQGAALVADLLLHYAVPAAALAWWWLYPPLHRIPSTAPLWWLLWPLGYLVYALLRGAFSGFYPYPFIDVATLGLPQVLANASGLCLVFLATAFLLRALAHARQRMA